MHAWQQLFCQQETQRAALVRAARSYPTVAYGAEQVFAR